MGRRHYLASTIVVLLLAFAVPADTAPTPASPLDDENERYFPLEEGNRWVYEVRGSGLNGEHDVTVDVTVIDSYRWHGMLVHRVRYYCEGLDERVIDFINDAGRTRELCAGELGMWYSWNDLSTEIVMPAFCGACLRGTRGRFVGEVTVHAGTGVFIDALRIEYYEWPCADLALLSETFAPGIGLVQREINTFTGTKTWNLLCASVGGTEIRPSTHPAGAPPVPQVLRQSETWGGIKLLFER